MEKTKIGKGFEGKKNVDEAVEKLKAKGIEVNRNYEAELQKVCFHEFKRESPECSTPSLLPQQKLVCHVSVLSGIDVDLLPPSGFNRNLMSNGFKSDLQNPFNLPVQSVYVLITGHKFALENRILRVIRQLLRQDAIGRIWKLKVSHKRLLPVPRIFLMLACSNSNLHTPPHLPVRVCHSFLVDFVILFYGERGILNNKLYVVGRVTRDRGWLTPQQSVEVFDPHTGIWSQIPSMPFSIAQVQPTAFQACGH
ncbi:hypothetical protein Dsin_014030 [Dipteronia sinensis]|uniref:Uncharacterized protein n=1 Tax=Dipteronia sinensis TaxID=43782 RepID=A0AAE0EB64_9ROSI|nr:hypothetical protein Dsin_014030 [Dipteronia sinensis]